MNIPINNIKNCDNLSIKEIINLKNKLGIKTDDNKPNIVCPLVRKNIIKIILVILHLKVILNYL